MIRSEYMPSSDSFRVRDEIANYVRNFDFVAAGFTNVSVIKNHRGFLAAYVSNTKDYTGIKYLYNTEADIEYVKKIHPFLKDKGFINLYYSYVDEFLKKQKDEELFKNAKKFMGTITKEAATGYNIDRRWSSETGSPKKGFDHLEI